MLKSLLTSTLLLFMLGCGTINKTDTEVTRASYIGDTNSCDFSTITVTVKDEKGKRLNLNINYSAIIKSYDNTNRASGKDSSYASSYDAAGIVRRMQTRIKSQVIQEVLYLKPTIITNQQMLHNILQDKAQSIFDKEYNKWSKSPYYNVRIVITSLYFTDMSVGGAPPSSKWQ